MRQKLGELEFSPWQFCLCREGSFLLSWFQPQLSGFLGCYKLHSTCSDLFLSCTSPFQRSDRVSALDSSQEFFKNPLCHNLIPGVDEAVVWCSHSWSTCGEGQNLCFLQLSRLSHETHPHRARELPDTGEFTQETVFLFVPKEKLKSKHVCYWSDDRMLREAFIYLHIERYLFISLILRLNAIGISRLDHC